MRQNICGNFEGNFSLVVALLISVLLIAAGVAIDFTNAMRTKEIVQGISDSAILSVTRSVIQDRVDLDIAQNTARRLYDAQILGRNLNLSVDEFKLIHSTGRDVSLRVRVNMPTSFLNLMGKSSIPIVVTADTSMGVSNTEIAIAFDTTNSMGFGTSWTDAIHIMEDSLEALGQKSDTLALTFIPFADRVNIGTARSDFLTNSDRTEARSGAWGGCVQPRISEQNDRSNYYMNDEPPNLVNRFEKFDNGTHAAAAPNRELRCNPMSILGPTSQVRDITEQLSKLTRSGTGRFDVGLAWAWRALSSNWKGHWSKGSPQNSGLDLNDYPKTLDQTNKIAVLVTDGLTNAYKHEFGKQNLAGSNTGSIEHFENLVSICQDMAKASITIFVIHINGNNKAEPYFRDCVSRDGGYYQVGSRQDLIGAFEGVTSVGGKLRLTR